MENKKTPEIRFAGFSEDWESTRAKKIFVSISDKNHADLPVLSASQEKGMTYRDDIGIDIKYDEKSTSTYKRVKPGQYVMHLRSFQGGFAYSDIEGITSPAYTVLDFIDKEKYYPLFWKNVFTSKNFIKRLETITYGIRDGRSISFADFSTLKFYVPHNNEQIKIGNYFKQLDDTIAIHQSELDRLKQVKRGFLQKLFPIAGKTIPEIRFSGFDGDWVKLKLGDISEIKTGPFGSTLHAHDYINNGVPIVTTEHFKNGYLPQTKSDIPQVSTKDYMRLKSYILREGDIVFSRVGSIDINALVTDIQDGWLFSGRVLRVRLTQMYDNGFLHYLLSTKTVREDIITRAVGQTMPSINTDILKKTTIMVSRNYDEQKKISQILKCFDNSISFKEREIGLLKASKQAFLQKMFI